MIFVAIGANLASDYGQPVEACEQALHLLPREGISIVQRSPWYKSAPVPMSDQPWYVNGVAVVETELDPFECLQALHRIESEMGRVRTVVNAPRVIDLDLLAYHTLCRDDASLVLPHPRMHERSFVMLPLQDIAPHWVHPRLGKAVADLVQGLPKDQVIQRMAHD